MQQMPNLSLVQAGKKKTVPKNPLPQSISASVTLCVGHVHFGTYLMTIYIQCKWATGAPKSVWYHILDSLDRFNRVKDFKHLLNNKRSEVIKSLDRFPHKLQDISSCCFIVITQELHQLPQKDEHQHEQQHREVCTILFPFRNIKLLMYVQ